MAKDKGKNIFKIFKSYLLTEDLKKLWHFYLFLIIFNTWLELSLFALYRPLDVNFAMFLTLTVGLLPLYGFSIYCIKYQAINKRRPYWVLPLLIILLALFMRSTPNNFDYFMANKAVVFYIDNSLYVTFLTALRIMFVVKNKKK